MTTTPETIYLKDYKVPRFLVPQINLHFDLHEDESFVTNTSQFQANPKSQEDTSTVFLDGESLDLVEITRNGTALTESDYELTGNGLLLKNCPETFELVTKVRLEPQNNKAFSGLYKTKTVFCTQMEAQGFRRTTFSMDRPDVLSKYTTTLEADKGLYPILLSNGNFIEQKDTTDGRHVAKWEDPFPKPSYLFALVAGDLDWIEDSYLTRSKRKVDLKIYVDKGKGERARFAMNSLKQSMKWDEDTYRLEYDLDIYNIVAVDDFNMGAMENKGLNIFNSKYVLASPQTATDDEYQGIQRVIGHEYFHNWTGNRVTCRDWFQLSLKEGLTVFRDQEFSSDMNSRPVKRIEDVAALRSRQFPEDSGPMAHPVRPSSYIAIDNFYTVTIYEKGAEVIRMLETIIGPDMFKKGVTKYFELYDGQAVTTDDWVHSMEVVSGRDLSQFKLWYDQTGTPQVSVTTGYDSESQTFEIKLQQQTVDPITKEANKAYHIPLKLGLMSESGVALEFEVEGQQRSDVIELTQDKQTFRLKNVYQKPILSINREFSAPIQLNYEQPDEDLFLLMAKDADSFNRWESAQKIFRQHLIKSYNQLLAKETPVVPEALVKTFSDLIAKGQEDPALTARVMELPATNYLGQFLADINPEKLYEAYEIFYTTISKKLHDQILEAYNSLHEKNLGNAPQDIALRAFKNNLLSYLYRFDEDTGAPIFYKQFKEAQNMTDSLAALHRLSKHAGSEYNQAMEEFHNQWSDDSLVLNKWFMVTSSSKAKSCFEQIKQRAESDAFQITNPNNVFALMYYFAQFNWPRFHTTSGEIYDWFADQVITVDQKNPQVASRLGSCFNNWKKFGPEYRTGMEKAIKKILDSSPSDNLYEIVSRALNN